MSLTLKSTNSPITNIVFDFDNTLYYADADTQTKMWHQSRTKLVNLIIEKQHLSPTVFDQLYAKLLETASQIGWSTAYVKLGGELNDYTSVIHQVSKADFVQSDHKLQSLICSLASHAKLHIFTGSSRHTVLEALDIILDQAASYFSDTLLASDDMCLAQKPDPAAYQEMLSVFNLNPATTLFIDDQLPEVNTAQSCGLHAFLIDRDHQYLNPPSPTLSSPNQLLEFISIE